MHRTGHPTHPEPPQEASIVPGDPQSSVEVGSPIPLEGDEPPAQGQLLARRPQELPPSVWRLPHGSEADEDGVVGIGADLHPSTLVDAYRRGIFPWPHEGVALPWFCPDPRAIMPLDGFHISRSLRTTLRRCGWVTTVDRDFHQVIEACAERPADVGTWITRDLTQAYIRLHRLGWAHSFEVWDGAQLVGGMYGVKVGQVFTGESMFHRKTDASKVALADAVARLTEAGAEIFDVQLSTPHLSSLGAIEVDRGWFLSRLEAVTRHPMQLQIEPRPAARLADRSPHVS